MIFYKFLELDHTYFVNSNVNSFSPPLIIDLKEIEKAIRGNSVGTEIIIP